MDDTLGENENESLDKIGEEDGDDVVEGQTQQQQGSSDNAVSYTHLTLPTIYSV